MGLFQLASQVETRRDVGHPFRRSALAKQNEGTSVQQVHDERTLSRGLGDLESLGDVRLGRLIATNLPEQKGRRRHGSGTKDCRPVGGRSREGVSEGFDPFEGMSTRSPEHA